MSAENVQEVKPHVSGANAIDISPNKDEGVLKEIIKEGTGEETPAAGDKVTVHYVGRLLDGTVFDSSRDRGEHFEFNLGKGEVIKGWDIGVKTMKRNEICILTCKPEYAYGISGSPPKIPPDATLAFEVELFDWALEDLSHDNDKGILRRIIKKGEGYATPNEDASVEIHLVGRYDGNTFEERDVSFIMGEGSEHGIVAGLETALESFNKGEKSLIKLKSKYAFGVQGKPELNIPENADVEYEVTLKSLEKSKDCADMENGELLEQAEIIKNKGTDYFKIGKYENAVKQYKKIIRYMDYSNNLTDDELKKKNSLFLAAHLNLAMCYLKLNEYTDAVKSCNDALQLDSENEKGLFRRGQAYFAVSDFEQALKDFQKVLKIDSNNKAAQKQVYLCKDKIKQQLEKERNTYRNMFEKFASQDSKKGDKEVVETGVWSTENDSGKKSDLPVEIMDIDSAPVDIDLSSL